MRDIKRRPNYEIVLRAMRNGAEVEMPDNNTYTIVDDTLCVKMKVWKGGHSPIVTTEPDEIHYIEADILFNTFSKWCDKLSEEQIIGLVFQLTMKNMNKRR